MVKKYADQQNVPINMLTPDQLMNVAQSAYDNSKLMNQLRNQGMNQYTQQPQTDRQAADPLDALAIVTQLKAAGLPAAWLSALMETIKIATNDAKNPAFADWSMVKMTLQKTIPLGSMQLSAINVVMEYLQTVQNKPGSASQSVFQNLLADDPDDAIGRAAKAFSMEALAEKFGAAVPQLRELVEDSLFGDTRSVMIVTEKDGVIEARIEKRPKVA